MPTYLSSASSQPSILWKNSSCKLDSPPLLPSDVGGKTATVWIPRGLLELHSFRSPTSLPLQLPTIDSSHTESLTLWRTFQIGKRAEMIRGLLEPGHIWILSVADHGMDRRQLTKNGLTMTLIWPLRLSGYEMEAVSWAEPLGYTTLYFKRHA